MAADINNEAVTIFRFIGTVKILHTRTNVKDFYFAYFPQEPLWQEELPRTKDSQSVQLLTVGLDS